jgi:hypothetical protein
MIPKLNVVNVRAVSNNTDPVLINNTWNVNVKSNKIIIGFNPLAILIIGIPPIFKIISTPSNIYIMCEISLKTKALTIKIPNAKILLLGSILYKKLFPGIY